MRNTYTEEQKAAVLASLIAGNTYAYVAEQYGIPEGTIKAWKAERDGSRSAVTNIERQAALTGLIAGVLEQELISLRSMAIQFQDEEWLRTQRADHLAILYGVMQDKAIRKIEAWADIEAKDTDTQD